MAITSASDVIKSQFIDAYFAEWEEIALQLQRVKERLHILNEIENFPFDLFAALEDTTFWRIVRGTIVESTVVILYTLVNDNKLSYHNFDQFVDRIRTSYLLQNNDAQNKVSERFDNYSQKINPLKPKINLIRNNFVAHNSAKEKILKKGRDKYQISHSELKEALDLCHELLNILGFGRSTRLDNWDYAPRPYAKNYFTDVELLLGFLARRSIYLREYSKDYSREMQAESYSELTDDERAIVDFWRKRVKDMGICDDEQ